MKKFSFQLIRYQPDRVSEEFVNVGLVMLDYDITFLKARSIGKIGRVKALFPDVKSKQLISKLKRIVSVINDMSRKWDEGLKIRDRVSLGEITSSIMPNDDSSIYFSDLKTGLDIDLNLAFQDLFNRFIIFSKDNIIGDYLTDKDVWNNYYKSYFVEYQNRIQSKSVFTKGDELIFEHALKNGTWNYLEPVSFDLTRESNIKDKVYKWMGKLEELDSSKESFKLFLLTKMPSNREIRKFIYERIENNSADNFEVKIIEPEDASDFARNIISSIEHS